jgi:hypothetical protein
LRKVFADKEICAWTNQAAVQLLTVEGIGDDSDLRLASRAMQRFVARVDFAARRLLAARTSKRNVHEMTSREKRWISGRINRPVGKPL